MTTLDYAGYDATDVIPRWVLGLFLGVAFAGLAVAFGAAYVHLADFNGASFDISASCRASLCADIRFRLFVTLPLCIALAFPACLATRAYPGWHRFARVIFVATCTAAFFSVAWCYGFPQGLLQL